MRKPAPEKGSRILPPQQVPSDSSNTTHPAFCFRYTQDSYDLKKCDKDLQAACAKRLQLLGKMTWEQICKAPRHGAGHEIIPHTAIKVPLPLNTPGDRDFLVFRLGCGKQSVIIGYRKEKIFYVVWIDPKGQVYSHG